MSLDIYRFYQRCLIPLTPAPAVTQILGHYLFGAETTDDFSKVIALDNEIQHWIRITVTRLGFHKAKNLNQMVELLGQNRIRDVIIGRHLERQFVSADKSLLSASLGEKGQKAEAPPPPAESKAVGTERHKKVVDESKSADDESVPNLADFSKYLEYANRAEQLASNIRNSYPGQAYAGGVLFDAAQYLLSSIDLSAVKDERLKDYKKFVDEVFKDGLRCGIAANEIMQKISIAHQKTVFVSALVHNIGKLLLFAYDPMSFERSFVQSQNTGEGKSRRDSVETEVENFDFDHAQAGALYLGRVPFLAEIEKSIDYHHNPHLLKFASPSLYALSCVLSVSGALAKTFQAARAKNPKVQNINDNHLKKSEFYLFLKLSDDEWEDVKSNFALKLIQVGL